MPKKIFEIAGELGFKPLDLVEKLKGHGFNVRNHMSVLSDEEVVKAESLLAPAQQAAPAESKKKVVKKKATKKKVVKKATAVAAEGEEAPAPEKKAKKKTSSKRKTVVRRKGDAEATKTESLASQLGEAVSSEESSDQPTAMETSREIFNEDMPGGLRVVAQAPAPQVEEEQLDDELDDSKKEYLTEKMHSFTPIYTPPKKEGQEQVASEEEEDDNDPNSKVPDDPNAIKPESKKRLGGLAAMMAKPRVAGKARDLSQLRADEELKIYSNVSSLGKNVYAPIKKKKVFTGAVEKTKITEIKDSKRQIQVHKGCTALELANKLKVKFKEFADKALDLNLLLAENDYIGLHLATELAALYNYRVLDKSFDESKALHTDDLSEEEKEKLPIRDPIITIMGHVDHGKTTLVDFIRNSKVVDSEAGGITQHIGAYSVDVKGKRITFLDTPGHAAFGAIRQRGANITDIVVLVVAADDGVMPQTKESVRFCQAAQVPIIIAINKMDKEGANPDRVKQELMEFNITPEEWGGDTQFVKISALKGEGIDELLDSIALQAEVMELRANPKGPAEGVVIESKIESGRGPVSTILVQSGTLHKGDTIVVGETFGRARSLMDYAGNQLKSAGPAVPVQVLGLNDVAAPGDQLNVAKNEREAKKVVDNRQEERKKREQTPAKKMMSLEDFLSDAQEGEGKKVLKLIVRADVNGSFEAIKNSLEVQGNNEVGVQVIGGGVGAITDSDVLLASEANGYIIGFNMRPVTTARKLAEDKGVDVRTYSIIYELIDDIKATLEGMLEPEKVEKYIGRAEVRDTFSIPKVGTIAGSAVIDGKIERGCQIRLLRDGKIVFDGKLSSLKRFKDDVKEVKNGLECGISLESFNDVKVNDIFEAYQLEEKKRKLEAPEVTI